MAYVVRISDSSSYVFSSDLPRTGVVRRNSDQTGSRGNGTRLIAAGHRSDIGARFAGKPRAPREPSRISTRPGIIGTEETGITEAVVHQSQIIRSEEHTSELQSLMRISYAVFCLKKKKQHTI